MKHERFKNFVVGNVHLATLICQIAPNMIRPQRGARASVVRAHPFVESFVGDVRGLGRPHVQKNVEPGKGKLWRWIIS